MSHPLFLSLLALVLAVPPVRAADDYQPGPDSLPQPGVPLGAVTKLSFTNSHVFPGTVRDYWVYVPAQYDAAKPACLMVFQDGLMWNATNVFNNLIHKKEIPVLIGVFVQPGVVPALSTNALPRYNRSFEYDSLGDRYAEFLLEELLPEVRARYAISTNASDCAIAGASSGGICAFTAAWERPDAFRRVFSSIGSFTDLRGGNVYPALIRKTEPKPLRVFLQDGANDLNIYAGSWWVANQDVFSALQFAGYAVTNTWGDGGHSGKQATAIFPDALRWLWRDWPAPVRANAEGRSKQPVLELLLPGEGWQQIAKLADDDGEFTGLAANPGGEVFLSFSDKNGRFAIARLGLDGKIGSFASVKGNVHHLAFGADGRLYFGAEGPDRIGVLDARGKESVFGQDLPGEARLVARSSGGFFTQFGFLDAAGQFREGAFLAAPGAAPKISGQERWNGQGLVLTPDQSQLYLRSEQGDNVLDLAQVLPDGALAHPQTYTRLYGDLGAGSAAVDAEGRLYALTTAGVEVCDQAGRVTGIVETPKNSGEPVEITFGGPGLSELYLLTGEALFKRKTKVTGVLSCMPPIKPAKPRL